MGIAEIIERARQAQKGWLDRHNEPRQMEISEDVTLWASEDEQHQHFLDTTYTPAELAMAQAWDMGISGKDF